MQPRLKKFIGTLAIVIGSVLYFWFVISIALVRLPGTALGTQILFYFIVSLIWFMGCAALIWWMQRPSRKPIS